MADVLDQAEVDALLSAIGTEEDLLMSGGGTDFDAATGTRPGTHAKVFDYDFKRPERVSKDQMRALRDRRCQNLAI